MELQELRPEVERLSQSAQVMLTTAGEPITTVIAYEGAAEVLKKIKGRYNELDDREKAITKPINDSLKAIRDLFRGPKDLLQQAEAKLKRGIIDYQQAEDRKRQEAQRQADADAEQERQRLAKLQVKAEARGDTEKAQQFEERAATVVAPIIETAKPKVAGIATRKDYDFEIVDASLLPREYLEPDEKKIRRVVKAMGKDANIPGIRIVEKDVIAARAS